VTDGFTAPGQRRAPSDHPHASYLSRSTLQVSWVVRHHCITTASSVLWLPVIGNGWVQVTTSHTVRTTETSGHDQQQHSRGARHGAAMCPHAAADSNALTARMRAELGTRLAKLDTKENYFLDLAADEGWPKDKLRDKIAAIPTERATIERTLEQAENRLDDGKHPLARPAHSHPHVQPLPATATLRASHRPPPQRAPPTTR
jgi:hypothetical protein